MQLPFQGNASTFYAAGDDDVSSLFPSPFFKQSAYKVFIFIFIPSNEMLLG